MGFEGSKIVLLGDPMPELVKQLPEPGELGA
jgi:hypothetical protein